MSAMPFVSGGQVIEIQVDRQSPPAIVLSDQQREAIQLGIEAAKEGGRFVFITGEAGVGKSLVTKRIRRAIKCIMLAPTGLAAINVGGQTIHSFFKFKIGPISKGNCRALDGEKADIVWLAEAILIDEISMVRADLMDAINWTLQKTMGNTLPFGGKTIIGIGDMQQLAPVVGEDDREYINGKYKSEFWFDSLALSMDGNLLDEQVKVETVHLNQIFRQKGNPEFVTALNQIRAGNAAGFDYINQRAGIPVPEGLSVPCLTFTNKKADGINADEMAKIAGDPVVFLAQIDGEFKKDEYPAPLELELKVGARVMVTKNTTATDGYPLVNGDMGEVVGFDGGQPVVWTDSGREVTIEKAEWKKMTHAIDVEKDEITEVEAGVFRQFPLKLAYAITVHKSQGQTLTGACLTLDGRSFAHGQTYVGLSRVSDFDKLFLARKLRAEDIRMHPRIKELFGTRTVVDEGAFG